MTKKKNCSVSLVVFGVLALLWGVGIVFFTESLDSARADCERLEAQEKAKFSERAELKHQKEILQVYTDKMLNDPDFVQKEARERLGSVQEGEIVFRPEEN